MAETAPRRPVRHRLWRRRALARSRSALALGGLVAVLLLVLLLLGLTRARPGREVPSYDPTATTTTTPSALPQAPVITEGAGVTTSVPPPKGTTATTRRHR